MTNDQFPMNNERRGAAFVITLWVIAVLAGLTLAIGHAVRVEATAAADRAGLAEADAAMLGAEQFVLSAVDAEIAVPGTVTTDQDFADWMQEGIVIGNVKVWIIRPDPDDETALDFGLTDEAGKLDLNSAAAGGTTEDQLLILPNMTQDVADSIMDWRGPVTTPRAEGAEDAYYTSLPTPYHCKNASFETVEELMLVKGVDASVLFGQDRTHSGRYDPASAPATQPNLMSSPLTTGNLSGTVNTGDRGLFPFVTVYGVKAGTTPPASTSTSLTGTSLTSATTSTVADVNANNQNTLRQVLTQFGVSNATQVVQLTQDRVSPQGRGAMPRPFANIWDWAASVNLTSADFSKVIHNVKATAAGSVVSGGGAAASSTGVAKINVNTAPEEVLECLPTLVQSDTDAIVAYRQNNPYPEDPSDISWMLDVVPKTKLGAIGNYITGTSSCYSADIVAATADGRVFKRCRIVVDASTGPAKIIYRRDLTSYGWPLPEQYRQDLRDGQNSNSQPMGVKPF